MHLLITTPWGVYILMRKLIDRSYSKKESVKPSPTKKKYFKSQLVEQSYSESDVPLFFYRAFVLNPRKLDDLVRHEFTNCEGVSEDSNIYQTNPEYTAQIMLPAIPTLRINKMYRIQYDNPEQMIQNNLWLWKRIVKNDSTVARIYSLLDSKHQTTHNPRLEDTIKKVLSDNPPIQSVKDLHDICLQVARKVFTSEDLQMWTTMTVVNFRQWFKQYLLENLRPFVHEKEWIIQDRTLNIPKDTILFQKKGTELNDYDIRRLEDAGYIIS